MMRIDSHQHFWLYHPHKQSWLTDEMKDLRRDFMPQDIAPIFKQHSIDGCVAVQAQQNEEETFFLLYLSMQYPEMIKGVVGWVDLLSPQLENRLQGFTNSLTLKGFRHIIQDEREDYFILRPDFVKGIQQIEQYGYTYDILIYQKHLPWVIEFLKVCPAHRFVIDHIAKPAIKNHIFNKDKSSYLKWCQEMKQISLHPNVYCKLSGMITEHHCKQWNAKDFKPYIDTVIDCFGVDRVMFGSDWPVCLSASTYAQIIDIIEESTQSLSVTDKQKLWGLNAIHFYNL